MIRFAAMTTALPASLPGYEAEATMADLAAARALLAGQRPKRIVTLDTLLTWAAQVGGVPDFMVAASLAACGDRAETAALILPPPLGQAPTLTEVLHHLTSGAPARDTLQNLWSRLPPQANHVLNRLATGTFRTATPKVLHATAPTRHIDAVLTLVQPAGPEVTLALWHDGAPVPVARLPLTLPATAEVMAWVRAHTTERFGPVRKVDPVLVFRVAFDGLSPNRRRKCGYDLVAARIVDWVHDGQAAPLGDLDAAGGGAGQGANRL